MKYARITDGIVTQIIDNVKESDIFYDLAFKFSINKRIDQLDPEPQVGWHYDQNTGFTEN